MRTQASTDQAFVRTAFLTCEQLLSKNYRLRHFLKKVLATYIAPWPSTSAVSALSLAG
jgi:hypothetical protein